MSILGPIGGMLGDAYSGSRAVGKARSAVNDSSITFGTTVYDKLSKTQKATIDAVKTLPGVSDVYIHGGKMIDGKPTVSYFKGLNMNPKEFAAQLRSSPNYDNDRVRLFSCHAGETGFAQELANELGVDVMAPSFGRVRIMDDGLVWFPDGGRWIVYHPQ